MIRTHTPALLFTALLGACAHTTARAQYFLHHLAGENTIGGWEPMPGADGGVRLVVSIGSGGELVLDEAGNITGAMMLTDIAKDQGLYLSELAPTGPTERLAFGHLDNGTGIATAKTMYLARITEGATTAQAAIIGPEDNTEWSCDLAVHPDGSVVLGRTFFGPVNDQRYKMILAKFDAALTPQWGVSVDVLDKTMQPIEAFVDPASGAITCYNLLNSPGPLDYFGNLVKLSSAGELLWSYSYNCEGNGYYTAGIARTEAGDFYTLQQLAGASTLDLVLSKITANGELQWSRKISAPQPGRLEKLRLHNGALYALCSTGFSGSDQNVLLLKLDLEGEPQWSHVYGVADRLTVANDLLFTTGTNGQPVIWLTGYFRLNGTSPQDILWMKLDAEGTGLDCALPDYVFTTTPTTSETIDGGVAAPYTHFGTATLGIGTLAVNEPMTECTTPTGVDEHTTALAHVAPVPTNGPCTLTFPATHGALRIRLLNALGQQVQEISVAANTPTLQLDLGRAKAVSYVLLIDDLRSGQRCAQRILKE